MSDDSHIATEALAAHAAGDGDAAGQLMPLVYDKLRAVAANYLKRERVGHTLQPTALVHEAYLKLIDINRMDWQGRTHFFAMAATQMRRLLVDHARAKNANKRAGQMVTLDEGAALVEGSTIDVLALNEALDRLQSQSPRQCKVAELRFFGGLNVPETAMALGVSERTVKQDWAVARAWLVRELESSTGS